MNKLLILVFVLAGCATKPDSAKIENVHPSLTLWDSGGTSWLAIEPEENSGAYRGGFRDYRSVVQKAADKDPVALRRFLLISANSPWDAASAEFHYYSTLPRMVLTWGDRDFARIVASEPQQIRTKLIYGLQMSNHRWEDYFPLTWTAALEAKYTE